MRSTLQSKYKDIVNTRLINKAVSISLLWKGIIDEQNFMFFHSKDWSSLYYNNPSESLVLGRQQSPSFT